MSDLRKLPIQGVAPDAGGSARALPVQGDLPDLPELVGLGVADDLDALVKSGWRFVRQDAGGVPSVGRAPVYLGPDHRLKIGTDRLVARFEPDVSRDDVGAILDKHGLKIVRWLIPDMNVVQVHVAAPRYNADCDVVGISEKLADEPNVRYAQPELIEVLKSR